MLLRREELLLYTLRGVEVGLVVAAFLAEDDHPTVGEPLPLVEEGEVHVVLLALLAIERMADGGLRIALEHVHLVLVAIHMQDDQVAGRLLILLGGLGQRCPCDTREVAIEVSGQLHGANGLVVDIIDAYGSFGIGFASLGIAERLGLRIVGT